MNKGWMTANLTQAKQKYENLNTFDFTMHLPETLMNLVMLIMLFAIVIFAYAVIVFQSLV